MIQIKRHTSIIFIYDSLTTWVYINYFHSLFIDDIKDQ